MLAKRIILSLTLNNGVLFRTKGFRPDYRYTLNFVDLELADEILLIDVTRYKDGGTRQNFWDTVDRFSKELFLPTTIGGRLRGPAEALDALRLHGADRVLINSEAVRRPGFITELAEKMGSQAVVVGIDVRDGLCYIDQGRTVTDLDPVVWALEVQNRGAGEILLMDMARDGSLQGYNLELLDRVADELHIPVIITGGCGTWEHMRAGFKYGAAACATSVIHHFTEPSLKACKLYLKNAGVDIRL